mmetsp:Transcript_988/g.3010  ORF Transcript_988/g.3010 Transcript_988/m.3010 type:complete len:330 (-) Transcript_988:1414-2403(-)
MQRSTFLSSHGRSFLSRIFSARRKPKLSSNRKSSSRASACTASTMSASRRLLAPAAAEARWPGPPASSAAGSRLSSASPSFSFFSCSSLTRSASSLACSSSRIRFWTASMRASSLAHSSSRQAFRFLVRSRRACSLSRSSFFLWAMALPAVPSSGGPKSSSTLASIRALQLTALRSSSQSSSSSVPTFSTACWDFRHCWISTSALSSTSTLISWPPSTRLERHVDAFHAASASPNCAKPKLRASPLESRPRLKAWTSPHCSIICCSWPSSSSGARRVTSRKILGFFSMMGAATLEPTSMSLSPSPAETRAASSGASSKLGGPGKAACGG